MLPKRKSLRLPNHDYACGWYFVTICTKDKRYSLGTVVGGDAHILEAAKKLWGDLNHRVY